MKILITGANGFIGKCLCEHLETEHTVYKLVRSKNGQADKHTIIADLINDSEVEQIFNIYEMEPLNIDSIIHCASILALDRNRNSFSLFTDNNQITKNVIFLARKLQAKTLINLSTIGVYPNISGVYTESSCVKTSINSEGLYGLSKFCSEELFSFFLDTTNVINLRLSQIYGPGMREDRIYSLFKKELLEKNSITVWANGERSSNFMSIECLGELIGKLVNTKDAKGVYNVGKENISYLQLAGKIIAKFGNSSSSIIKMDIGTRSKVIIDCSKIEKVLLNET